MKTISQITGGLGNQMFQYACGKSVANRLGAKFFLDLSWFKIGNRIFMLDAFPNIRQSLKNNKHNSLWQPSIFQKILRRLKINAICYINEPHFSYWPGINNIKSSTHLSGYWQNENYFSDITPIIRQQFIFPDFSCLEAENIAQKIKSSSCSVSIHIRRGDYVEDTKTNQFHGICTTKYYEKALQTIIEKCDNTPELYIFSDDPDWIKNNFNTHGYSSVIVDIPEHKNAPYHDMHLMSLCQHHIIANSSFSWWGAWLSGGDGMVIAPRYWFADETMRHYNPSLTSWVTIE